MEFSAIEKWKFGERLNLYFIPYEKSNALPPFPCQQFLINAPPSLCSTIVSSDLSGAIINNTKIPLFPTYKKPTPSVYLLSYDGHDVTQKLPYNPARFIVNVNSGGRTEPENEVNLHAVLKKKE